MCSDNESVSLKIDEESFLMGYFECSPWLIFGWKTLQICFFDWLHLHIDISEAGIAWVLIFVDEQEEFEVLFEKNLTKSLVYKEG